MAVFTTSNLPWNSFTFCHGKSLQGDASHIGLKDHILPVRDKNIILIILLSPTCSLQLHQWFVNICDIITYCNALKQLYSNFQHTVYQQQGKGIVWPMLGCPVVAAVPSLSPVCAPGPSVRQAGKSRNNWHQLPIALWHFAIFSHLNHSV